ncbi:hypothetical protein DLE54_11375 [Psychrobacter sp. YP14]|nr:hypothetical protein DLE54_11375 [Psychrobacter sp. YP14]
MSFLAFSFFFWSFSLSNSLTFFSTFFLAFLMSFFSSCFSALISDLDMMASLYLFYKSIIKYLMFNLSGNVLPKVIIYRSNQSLNIR